MRRIASWFIRWQLPGGETRCEKGFRDRTATEQESARREREAARKVAAELRRAMPTDAAPETKVFGRIPRMRDLMHDLERAEIDYKDADGRQADFHSLRMTFGTMLAKNGVAPRTAMELMRHTDLRLMMNVYTDPSILNTAGAVEDLPDVTRPPEAAAPLLTGSDGAPADISTKPKVLPKSTRSPDAHGHSRAGETALALVKTRVEM
ncbi:MAG: tyrosine-type recombinase/integrase [Planctomycetota bacterium]|nr:tyrosine-type recombinase/integrase [Planctomycetota bacterium]